MKISVENDDKKSFFKKRLLFDEEEGDLIESLMPLKNKRTFSESSLVEKQKIGQFLIKKPLFLLFFFEVNRKYLNIQKRLLEQGFHKTIQELGIETVLNVDTPDIPTIDGHTLKSLMQERRDVIVIDTRFSFEYEGFD